MERSISNKTRSLRQKEAWKKRLTTEKTLHREIQEAAGDILYADSFRSTKNHIQHGNVTVNQHCMSVARYSLSFAHFFERVGLRTRTTELIRGALLHDYFLYDWHDPAPEHMLHGFFHPGKALKNAMRDYDLTEVEQDIIKKHMWPLTWKLPACRETWIVLMADKWVSTLETLGMLKGHGRYRNWEISSNDEALLINGDPFASNETIFKKLRDYSKEDIYPLHMPGHKRGEFGALTGALSALDYTEIIGFDNLHEPEGMLLRAEMKASKLMGSDKSFLLVNGSTCGVQAAISGTVPLGGRLLMVRNAHKSAYYAVALRNIKVDYLYPEINEEFQFCEAVTPKQVQEALDEKEYDAVFIVSPTYEGRIADVKKIAEIVHQKKIPLIVDEAHGAHLGLHPDFAQNSNRLGADIVIQSTHKTLPSLTQTALLHINHSGSEPLVDVEKIKRFLHIYQTSSPSYILMASIENALDLVNADGERLFSSFSERYKALVESLSQCKNLHFVALDEVQSKKQDIGKLVIGLPGQGEYLLQLLHNQYGIDLEMASEDYALAMFTIGDTLEGYERLEKALLDIDELLDNAAASDSVKKVTQPHWLARKVINELSLGEAFEAKKEAAILETSVDKISGDFVFLYPPGAPILVPGERITEDVIATIQRFQKENLIVQGLLVQENKESYISVLVTN